MDAGQDRVTVQEAARRLGVTEQAVRKRVKRGTLESETEAGRVYVYLDAGYEPSRDEVTNPASDALISELRDQVAYLRDESRRKDEIIMQQAMTMRQLTTGEPPASSEGPESASESAGGVEDREPPSWPETETSQGSERRRSWWRRLFGR